MMAIRVRTVSLFPEHKGQRDRKALSGCAAKMGSRAMTVWRFRAYRDRRGRQVQRARKESKASLVRKAIKAMTVCRYRVPLVRQARLVPLVLRARKASLAIKANRVKMECRFRARPDRRVRRERQAPLVRLEPRVRKVRWAFLAPMAIRAMMVWLSLARLG